MAVQDRDNTKFLTGDVIIKVDETFLNMTDTENYQTKTKEENRKEEKLQERKTA